MAALMALVAPAALRAQVVVEPDRVENWPPCRHTGRDVCDGKKAQILRLDDGEEIDTDGRLDDPAWRRAEWIRDFVQLRPLEGVMPSERTEVALAYDRTTMYVGARLFSRDPSQIRAILKRRDDSADSERIIVSIDSYHDRRTSYNFAVTAAGGRLDWYSKNDTDDFRNRDYSFNPIWTAAATIDSLGWTAEFRIPLSQLRFNVSLSMTSPQQGHRTKSRRNVAPHTWQERTQSTRRRPRPE